MSRGTDAQVDWESALRQQNSANDELCSENGRLRVEAERLRAEDRAEAASAPATAALAAKAVAEALSTPESLEEEILQLVLGAASEVLAAWPPTLAIQASLEEDQDEELTDGSFISVADGLEAWRAEVAHLVEAAMKEACKDVQAGPAAGELMPAEEMAVLVGEKIALRELVERQQERVEALEMELHNMGAAVPSPLGGGLVGGAALSLAAAARGLGGLSEVPGGALSAGRELWGMLHEKPKARIAEPGCEYEVVGSKGAIVRTGESLRTDKLMELAPGTRIRVVSLSDKHPRRVEIVAVSVARPLPENAATNDRTPAEVAGPHEVAVPSSQSLAAGGADAEADDGYAADSDGEGSGPASGTEVAVTAVEEASPQPPPAAAAPGPVTTAAVAPPVIGWISAATKDGTLIIRAVPHDGLPTTEEVNEVTLSTAEWDALHQDREASLRCVEALSVKLNEIGCELLQSFEMRTVLHELQLGVERAREREARMREVAAVACEDLLSRRWARWPAVAAGAWEPRTACQQRRWCQRSPCERAVFQESAQDYCGVAKPPSEVNNTAAALQDICGVAKLISELNTTAAALQVAKARLGSLEREAEELLAERECIEAGDKGELSGLRSRLRRAVGLGVTGPLSGGWPQLRRRWWQCPGGDCTLGDDWPGDGLFRRRMEDLRNVVRSLREELRRAASSEAALRRSVEARSAALRDLLRREAISELAMPQCGPLRLPWSQDAERQALRAAVEEQLRWNLELRHVSSAPDACGATIDPFAGAATWTP